MDMNSVNLTGRLTADPQLRYTANDAKAVVNLRVAINGRNDRADYVDVTAWGKVAEAVAEHKSKGDQVAVSGRITSSDWTDDNGERHFRTAVTADEVNFLGRAKQRGEA
jgi:single-strand DNA-binding protein